MVRQSGGLTGGKRPGDFSAQECWQGVRFDRTAGCPSQGVGRGITDRDVDAIQLSIRSSETWIGWEARFLSD